MTRNTSTRQHKRRKNAPRRPPGRGTSGSARWPVSPSVAYHTRLAPEGTAVTPYWWATAHGAPTTGEYLAELGRRCAWRAKWERISPRPVLEGGRLVDGWPEPLIGLAARLVSLP